MTKRDPTFSERMAHVRQPDALLLDDIPGSARTRLLNAIQSHYVGRGRAGFWQRLLDELYSQPIDFAGDNEVQIFNYLKSRVYQDPWNRFYDLIEFFATKYPEESINNKFVVHCNEVLEDENLGYRFVDKRIVPITNLEEIAEITTARNSAEPFGLAAKHIDAALRLIANREQPDPRNSIKESISAVEAACRIVAKAPGAVLSDALGVLKQRQALHPALEAAFTKLYAYTSDAEGIRHALLSEPSLDVADARFMLIACSAFVNYLKAKNSESPV